MPDHRSAWDKLPLFASDKAIGAAAFGPDKAGEFQGIATLLEGKGFPKIHPLVGMRYVPAVKAFFDREYELIISTVPMAPDGEGDASVWNRKRASARRG